MVAEVGIRALATGTADGFGFVGLGGFGRPTLICGLGHLIHLPVPGLAKRD